MKKYRFVLIKADTSDKFQVQVVHVNAFFSLLAKTSGQNVKFFGFLLK